MESTSPSVLTLLRALGGTATSADLQTRLGVSQPTVSRALAPLVRSGQVRKVGAARSQRYLLPRAIPGVGDHIPVMRVDAAGQATLFGHITPLPNGRFWVDEADGARQLHDGLPWFLGDMRPQGFMGRTFAHAHPELQLGADPRFWSDEEVVKALALFGDDLPGNLVVGEAAFARYQSLPQRAGRVASYLEYPRLAEQAMLGTLPGSSAGGEQPKFCTLVGEEPNARAVIVKFSPAGDSPTDQRSRDLLVCEHLALQTLAQAGMPAAVTQIHSAGGRVFLEAERFDRTTGPNGVRGRIGMVSLLVYDSEYVGSIDNWAATANRMGDKKLLTTKDVAQLRLLEAYGVLIANTDRHYGNISLLLFDDDWQLSPTYDMLPMLYAPQNGELVPRDFVAQPLHPTSATLGEWPRARELALLFWRSAAADARISEGFRTIAQRNAAHLLSI